jgi:hypothetical protein
MTTEPASTVGQVEPYVLWIGDIGVTKSWLMTPRGYAPLAGSEWFTVNRSGYTQQIPVWAIICAIVLFPFGLLFLLCKETKVTGWIEVTVRAGQLVHMVAIPAGSPQAASVHLNVGYAQAYARQAASS